MRTKGLVLGVVLAAVAAIGVVALTAAAQKPMTGSIALVGGPAADCEGGVEIRLAGEGTLAHLGRAVIDSTNCTGVDHHLGTTGIWAGVSSFEAADGSTIEATFEGSQQVPVGDVAAYTTTHTITGGTGRFEGATGTWIIAGTVDLSTGELLSDVSGWLRH